MGRDRSYYASRGRDCTSGLPRCHGCSSALPKPSYAGSMTALRASKQDNSQPLYWRRLLRKAAKQLREITSAPIARAEAQRMARYLVSELVPRRRPGQKPTLEVLSAMRLKQQGKPWATIYPRVLVDYDQMAKYERSWRCFRLRRAVAANIKRRRLRDSVRRSH